MKIKILTLIGIVVIMGCLSKKQLISFDEIIVESKLNPDNSKVVWVNENQEQYFYNRYEKQWIKLPILDQLPASYNEVSSPKENPNSFQKNILQDVKKFGAKGNGKTDDSKAIQKAINYCSKKGLVLAFPKGTYLVKELDINISLYSKNGATLKLLPHANTYLGNVYGKDLRMENITFDGNVSLQDPPTLTQNYDGVAKNSLLQSFFLFDNLIIENCQFKNTSYGAIAFAPINQKGVIFCYPEKQKSNIVLRKKVQTLFINNCTFEDIGTEAIRFTPHQKEVAEIRNLEIIFPGQMTVENCVFKNVGSFTKEKLFGNIAHGNTILTGSLKTLLVQGCSFFNSARVELKLGMINNITSRNNKSYNSWWGHMQTQTQAFHPTANIIKGKVLVENVSFFNNRKNGHGYFVQLNGSQNPITNHAKYPNIQIRNNNILYLQDDNAERSDCIQLTESGNYSNIFVENNYCYGLHRGFLEVSRADSKRYPIEMILINNNQVLGKRERATAANSLFFMQSVNSENAKIGKLEITNNRVEMVQTGIILKNALIQSMIVENNSIQCVQENVIRYNGEKKGVIHSQIKHNDFSGKVFGFKPNIMEGNKSIKNQ